MDTINATALSTDQVMALRHADSIVFRFDLAVGGFSQIEARKSVDTGDGFGRRELHVTAPAGSPVITDYGASHTSETDITEWCQVFGSAQFWPALVTAFTVLKAGDTIRPRVTANSNGRLLDEAGLALDEFAIEIVRPKPNGSAARFHFLLDTIVRSTSTRPRGFS